MTSNKDKIVDAYSKSLFSYKLYCPFGAIIHKKRPILIKNQNK